MSRRQAGQQQGPNDQRMMPGWVWAATGAALLLLLFLSVLVFPTMLVRHDLGRRAACLTPDQLAKATNDARTTLLQGLGGLAVFAGAVVAYRQLTTGREQLRVAQEGQITERFTRAVSQLGDDKSLDIRLGGIYALERIANDSPVDRAATAEILTAYVRGHSPWPPSRRWQPPPDTAIVDLQPLRLRAPAVQACMTVLARSSRGWGVTRLDLGDADLRKADLADANLQEANLAGSHLEGANLDRARLDAAHLQEAWLEEASLHSAHLPRAFLASARLRKANLNSAHLQGAKADAMTVWPNDFDPQVAGVVLENEPRDQQPDGSA